MKYDNDFSCKIKANLLKLTYNLYTLDQNLYTLDQLIPGLKSENNFIYIP